MGLNHNDVLIDKDAKCVIDVNTRKITNSSNKSILLQFDHNSERVGFTMDRYIDGHDMYATDRITVNFANKDSKSAYIVTDVDLSFDGKYITFTWLISSNATQHTGPLVFGVNFRCIDSNGNVTYNWSTLPCAMFTVSESFNFTDDVDVDAMDDILASFQIQVNELFEEFESYENVQLIDELRSYVTAISRFTTDKSPIPRIHGYRQDDFEINTTFDESIFSYEITTEGSAYSFTLENLEDSTCDYRIFDEDHELIEHVSTVKGTVYDIKIKRGWLASIAVFGDQPDYIKITRVVPFFNKADRPVKGYENFGVKINYSDYTKNGTDENSEYTDYGVIALPENYSPNGTPTRLIIFCQGTGERTKSNTNPLSNYGWSYFLSKGYAVLDMNGMSEEWGEEMGFPITDQHFCNKFLLSSYAKGYEYVTKKYNLDPRVFVAGISMGGGASALIVQSKILPVIAHVAFCPALSVYKQDYMNPWYGEDQQKTIAGQWGFGDWETASYTKSYFLANYDKVIGFDNLLINTIGDHSKANNNYGNQEERNAYNSMSKMYPVPLKIWHCLDDDIVYERYSEFMVKMIKNAGGQAWLRTFESGGHVGGWSNGTVSDTSITGSTITTSIPFYEAIKFLERFV